MEEQTNALLPIFWLTGNSGAGKSTLAFGLKDVLYTNGITNIVVLDGDELRATISTQDDLSAEGRRNHNLRVARLAKLLQQQGLMVIVCVIAPFASVRTEIEAICAPQWIYVQRDGIEATDKPYEPPVAPALTLNHSALSPAQSLEQLLAFVQTHLA